MPITKRSIGVRYLLDVNILVALAIPDHVLHEAAHLWFQSEPDRLWATCPLTQAGFLRVASRALAGSGDAIGQSLARLEFDCRSSCHEYWPVDIDMRELSDSQRARLIGPNQITDMQLLLIARRHRGQLATFDKGLGELAKATGCSKSVLVLQA
jgi:toxin-antitoxin system PIN domain toxin